MTNRMEVQGHLHQEDDKEHREEHLKLSSVIKGVHKHLRRKFRQSQGDYEEVWSEHAQDSAILESYATAMKRLATEHWVDYPESRIDWCQKVIQEYFTLGGLKRALEKDAKHRFFEIRRQMEIYDGNHKKDEREQCHQLLTHKPPCVPNPKLPENGLSQKCGDRSPVTPIEQTEMRQDKPGHQEWLTDYTEPVVSLPLRLLDVGSCYNPFKDSDLVQSLAIDLCPADESVFQCDFLQLQLVSPSSHLDQDGGEDASNPNCFQNLRSPIHQLSVCSFDVVVCCLLLEYLPSPAQRAQCCVKACRLLSTNGLLLLITPDSNSSHRNAPMMKSWRNAMKMAGMSRWKYHKMQHLHCMAFRKVREFDWDVWSEVEHQMTPLMYIPQDFTDACYDDVVQESNPTEEEDIGTWEENEESRSLVLEELPSCLSDSEEDVL